MASRKETGLLFIVVRMKTNYSSFQGNIIALNSRKRRIAPQSGAYALMIIPITLRGEYRMAYASLKTYTF
jgi:hypothetical protein